ncbi:T9SS type A sorting domain-containing protein [Flavobacterium sp.]|uniref:T9SS type A sorting domain-containing protein n=1 Tax=Flavobacterium sp. TaxID=239 RepID=UPI00260389AB|nr:T9SS type A sorting domain-containing protein [Flavobacterium sp.]
MKTTFTVLLTALAITLGTAQQKTTGVKNIGSMTVKIDMNQATSLLTFTMTGPATKWLSVGLAATTMSTNTPIDVITYTTVLLDQHLSGGHNAAVTDGTNNLTLVSNTVSGSTRTIVATRPFSTGDANDHTFTYATNSINLIWAVGPNTNFNSEHSTKGNTSATFTTVLGVDDITLADKITVYPNPSDGNLLLDNRMLERIENIKVFNTDAQLVKELQPKTSDASIPLNLSGLSSGVYFLEISNADDRIVRKIEIN